MGIGGAAKTAAPFQEELEVSNKTWMTGKLFSISQDSARVSITRSPKGSNVPAVTDTYITITEILYL